MNFFGFIWVISYVSSLFAPQNSFKLPDSLSKVLPVKTLSFISNTVSRSYRNERIQVAATASSTDAARTSPLSFSLNLNRSHYRTVPQTQTLKPTFNWLNLADHSLFKPDWGRRSPVYNYQAALPVVPFISALDPEQSNEQPRGVMRFLGNLSRWQKGITNPSLTAATVTVVRASRRKAEEVTRSQEPEVGRCGLHATNSRDSAKGTTYQVLIKGQVIAEMPTRVKADLLAQRLRQVLQEPDFNPYDLRPTLVEGIPAGKTGNHLVFLVDQGLAKSINRTGELIAIDWINNLRTALDVPTLSLAEAQAKMHRLDATGEEIEGVASWYGPYFHGRLTANGEVFDENKLTAAHPSLPFNTYLKVTNLESGNTVIVRINDRGPYIEGRSLDLSREAARCLNSEISGVVPFKAEIMDRSLVEEAVPAQPSESSPDSQIADRRLSQSL
jgi:rare lipoprotein A